MRLLVLAMLLIFLKQPIPSAGKADTPKQQKAASTQQASSASQRGTEQSPLVVKTIPLPRTQEESAQEAKDRGEKSRNDRHIVRLTGLLVFIGFLQFLVYAYQARKLRETVKSAGEQSEAMERHIGEAARSATAMESIATFIQSGNTAIMRAYLSVVIGGGMYQARQDGIKFEGKPNLVNTGGTPARNVRIRIAAQLVPRSEAETFTYPLPEEIAKASTVVAPHQTYMLSAIAKDFVPDVEVADVKHGQGPALTVWGVVTYDDIFGDNHTTKFAQWLFWYPNNTLYGYYIPGQNDMS